MKLLEARAVDERELMDDPHVDLRLLERTYRQFEVVNAALSRWRHCYVRWIRPTLPSDRTSRLLDIGSGGGDVARALHRWAAIDGLGLEVLAIDPDPRAHAFATRSSQRAVRFEQTTSSALVTEGRTFDIVISNHVLHHLAEHEVSALVRDSEHLGERLVLHNDLRRSAVALTVYATATAPLASTSLLRADGMTSIRRSYLPDELSALAPAPWQIVPMHPYRQLLVLDRRRAKRS